MSVYCLKGEGRKTVVKDFPIGGREVRGDEKRLVLLLDGKLKRQKDIKAVLKLLKKSK